PRIHEVSLYAGIRCHASSPDHVGLHEHPRTVADGSYRFPLREKIADKRYGRRLHSQRVRILESPRQHETVVIVGTGRLQRGIDVKGVSFVAMVHPLDDSRLGGDYLDSGPCGAQRFAWP